MPPARPGGAPSDPEETLDERSPLRERRWQVRCELVLAVCLLASSLLPGELGVQAAVATGWTPFASLLLALLVASLALFAHAVVRPETVRRSSGRWGRTSGYAMLIAGAITVVGVVSASLGYVPVGLYSPSDGTYAVNIAGCGPHYGAVFSEATTPVFPPGARVTVHWNSSNGTNVTFVAGQIISGAVGTPGVAQLGTGGEFVETGSGGHSSFVAYTLQPPDNCSSLGSVSVSWAYQLW